MRFGKFEINGLVALVTIVSFLILSIEILKYLSLGCVG